MAKKLKKNCKNKIHLILGVLVLVCSSLISSGVLNLKKVKEVQGYSPVNGRYVFDNLTGDQSSIITANRYENALSPSRNVVALDYGALDSDNLSVLQMDSGIAYLYSTDTLVLGSMELGGGSVAIADGASITLRQPVWFKDSDSDGIPSSLAVYVGDRPEVDINKNIRMYDGATQLVADCNDTDPVANLTVNGYIDGDGDGYGVGSLVTCGVVGTTYADNNTDCNDTGVNSANVWSPTVCYVDGDNDGYGIATSKSCTNNSSCDLVTWASDGDGTAATSGNFSVKNTDCDDTNNTVLSVVASGGTVSTNGDVITRTFTGNGTFTFSCPTNLSVDALVVAGGGGAGYEDSDSRLAGGGGGGGGVVYKPSMSLSAQSYSVTVGGGGSGGNTGQGSNGSNSVFAGLTAIGGGGGGTNTAGVRDGKNGGSGGGGGSGSSNLGSAGTGTQPSQSGDSGTYGYGNNGGVGVLANGGGGGGGAGGAASGLTPGPGFSVFGSLYGAGGRWNHSCTAGTANTGNGGDTCNSTNGGAGGAGGKGVVVVRYTLP